MDVRISAGNAKRTREQLDKMKEEKVINRLKKALIVQIFKKILELQSDELNLSIRDQVLAYQLKFKNNSPD